MYNKVTLENTNEGRMFDMMGKVILTKQYSRTMCLQIDRFFNPCIKDEEAKFTKIHKVNLNTPSRPSVWGLLI